MDIQQELNRLQKDQETKAKEAARLKALLAEFPDLQKHVGRWNKVAYYSKTVNSRVMRFDLRHNCGCCQDSPLELWPYLETPHGKVYSDPPCFRIGERHWIAGDTPYTGWKDTLTEAGVPEEIIGAVSMYFKRGFEKREAAVEDSSYEDR